MTHITLPYEKCRITSQNKNNNKKNPKKQTVKFQLISATSDDFQNHFTGLAPSSGFVKNTVITYPKDICHFFNTRENFDWSCIAWPRGILGSRERFFKELINRYGMQNPNNINSVLMSAKFCFLLVFSDFYECDFLDSLQYTNLATIRVMLMKFKSILW